MVQEKTSGKKGGVLLIYSLSTSNGADQHTLKSLVLKMPTEYRLWVYLYYGDVILAYRLVSDLSLLIWKGPDSL